ncbi:MAG TPA: Cu(I)-responsive transcriptional regulator [Hyphomicrobiaceae bacterium]|nr:Cu(I)-responsive transcriptional regulator [Hyphomicrobiaceae bacterium]
MNIGEAAAASGVSAKMIRYYEKSGLIRPATRTGTGAYRVYQDDDVHTLRFIRRARDLGFSVEEISHLLQLWHNRTRASADVKQMALEKVADLKTRIAEMQAMARSLEHLAQTCHGDDRPQCPILDDLAGKSAAPLDNMSCHKCGTDEARSGAVARKPGKTKTRKTEKQSS